LSDAAPRDFSAAAMLLLFFSAPCAQDALLMMPYACALRCFDADMMISSSPLPILPFLRHFSAVVDATRRVSGVFYTPPRRRL